MNSAGLLRCYVETPPPRLDLVELVLGHLRSEVTTTPRKSLRASACPRVHRVVATAGRRRRHRERILPARHVRLQLGCRRREFGTKAIGHPLYSTGSRPRR
jgi:hypothetical protein